MNSRIYLGTCGWSYKNDWDKIFYPKSLKQEDYLLFYNQVFNSVEIDSSFYNIPSQSSVINWIEKTDENFRFSSKIPREITHKNIKDIDKTEKILKHYYRAFSPMENRKKLIGHLIQLPPKFSFQNGYKKLKFFFVLWNKIRDSIGYSYSKENFDYTSWRPIVEFRNISWMREETFQLLEEYNIGYCNVIEPLLPPLMNITRKEKDIFYLRFHGFGNKPWWNYHFSKEEISKWAKEIRKIIAPNQKIDYIIYFNNHYSGNAVKNAMELKLEIGLKNEPNIKDLQKKFQNNQKSISLDKWIT